MIPLFIEYLSAFKKLPLQGVGEIKVERIAAQIDISGRQVIPPASLFAFTASSLSQEKEHFITWLGYKLGTDAQQAELRYSQFIKDWVLVLQQHKSSIWKGVGAWQVNDKQEISFTPEMSPAFEGLPVRAEKLIRENSTHQIRVGEDHRSSDEMTALLTAKTKKVSIDLWLGVSALVVLLLFWCLFLYQHPLSPDLLANPQKALESLLSNK